MNPADARSTWGELFVRECRACVDRGGGAQQIARLVTAALVRQAEDPTPTVEDEILHRAPDLMIVRLTLPPASVAPPHTHAMWAVIGVAVGVEEDVFYARGADGLVETHRCTIGAGEALVLEPDVIHSIRNPRTTTSLGLHVYGGDLARTPRRMWDPYSGEEQPMDGARFERWCEELRVLRRESF